MAGRPAVLTSGHGGERRVPAPGGGGTEATFRAPQTSSSGSLLSVVLVCTPFGCKASAFLSSPSRPRELLTLREL